MPPKKINDTELARLNEIGTRIEDMAKHFGASPGAVSKRLKDLGLKKKRVHGLPGSAPPSESVPAICEDVAMNAAQQLEKINSAMHSVLSRALLEIERQKQLENKSVASLVNVVGEIRQQIRLVMDIQRQLYDVQAMQEFQREVVAILEEETPHDLRKRILERLAQKRSLRRAVGLS